MVEFRTIRYFKRSDIKSYMKRTKQAHDALVDMPLEKEVVVRLLIDSSNIVVIEFAGEITIENIRKATELPR